MRRLVDCNTADLNAEACGQDLGEQRTDPPGVTHSKGLAIVAHAVCLNHVSMPSVITGLVRELLLVSSMDGSGRVTRDIDLLKRHPLWAISAGLNYLRVGSKRRLFKH